MRRFTRYGYEIREKAMPQISEVIAVVSREKRVYVRNTAAREGANVIRLV